MRGQVLGLAIPLGNRRSNIDGVQGEGGAVGMLDASQPLGARVLAASVGRRRIPRVRLRPAKALAGVSFALYDGPDHGNAKQIL